jgi:hypothetical protein
MRFRWLAATAAVFTIAAAIMAVTLTTTTAARAAGPCGGFRRLASYRSPSSRGRSDMAPPGLNKARRADVPVRVRGLVFG